MKSWHALGEAASRQLLLHCGCHPAAHAVACTPSVLAHAVLGSRMRHLGSLRPPVLTAAAVIAVMEPVEQVPHPVPSL